MPITKIAILLGIKRHIIYRYIKEFNLTRPQKFNQNYFEKIDNQNKAYWLGFLCADGCISLTQSPKVLLKLCFKDKQHLEKWHEALSSNLRISFNSKTAASQHYSKKMCEDLIKLGCVPRKSLKLEFPSLPKQFISHFVREYFDGDGCASIHNKKHNLDLLLLAQKIF